MKACFSAGNGARSSQTMSAARGHSTTGHIHPMTDPFVEIALTLLYPERRELELEASSSTPSVCTLNSSPISKCSPDNTEVLYENWHFQTICFICLLFVTLQEAAAYVEMARLVNLVPSCLLVFLGAWVSCSFLNKLCKEIKCSSD